MKFERLVVALLAALASGSAGAQFATQPLNLRLPPEDASGPRAVAAPSPDEHATVRAPARGDSTTTGAPVEPAAALPVVPPDSMADNPPESTPQCDDARYGQPQVHGSATVGVIGGSHVSGNYQAGEINVSKAFGSCDHPTGGVGLSIDVGQGTFRSRRQGWRR